MSAIVNHWRLLQGGLALLVAPVPALLGRRYGAAAGVRAVAALLLSLGAQCAAVARLVRRAEAQARGPGAADALTLSRATGAAVLAAVAASGVRDRSGLAGRLAWGALLWGETMSDWFDGKLARRRGATALGATLDLEADSWLTLWAAVAAAAWGDLPPAIMLAPTLRYLPGLPSGSRRARRWWARATGLAQMGVITVALCPATVRRLRCLARRAAPGVAMLSLLSLGAQLPWHHLTVILRRDRRSNRRPLPTRMIHWALYPQACPHAIRYTQTLAPPGRSRRRSFYPDPPLAV